MTEKKQKKGKIDQKTFRRVLAFARSRGLGAKDARRLATQAGIGAGMERKTLPELIDDKAFSWFEDPRRHRRQLEPL